MLRLDALRKRLPISQKAPQHPWLWVWTGQPQVGVGNGKLVPHWGVEGHLAWAPAAPPFHSAFDHLIAEDRLVNKTLGGYQEKKEVGSSGWEWTQTLHLGSLLRPVRLGAKIAVLLPAGVESESVREEESLAIQLKACFSRKVC